MISDTTNGKDGASEPVHVLAIMGSTRQGRFGDTVAKWFVSVAEQRDDLTIELIDLRDWPLPFFNEPKSPSSGDYAIEAKGWSEKIAAGEAFVIITPEYNWGYPGVLKNALDHIYYEWNDKPVSFVGYGSVSGGSSSVRQLRQVAGELLMLPLRNEVLIQSPWKKFDEQGRIKDQSFVESANTLLDQLVMYASALTPMRIQKKMAAP